MVLSEPAEEDDWKVKKDVNDEGDGFLGFVHNAVIEHQLAHHDAPEDIEFYFCGYPVDEPSGSEDVRRLGCSTRKRKLR